MAKYAKKPTPSQRPKKSRGGLVATLLVFVIIIGLGGLYLANEVTGLFKSKDAIVVEIPQGASTVQIAQRLEEAGVIDNTLLFRLYSRSVAKADGLYQYGEFSLTPGDGYRAIINSLKQMQSYRETVTVTFPEGYNAYQIGATLETAGLFSQADFLEALNTHTFDVDFISEISDDPLKMVRLDGFLFPDTYFFYSDATPDDVILTLLKTFEEKVLTDERRAELAASDYTLEELIIFSSIIQKEAANVEEMYNVSSVFTNRMEPGSEFPQLESCTTNNYIADYIKPAYDGNPPEDVLKAYDTYGMVGFPVGAIANPGLDAIDAALHPNDTPYYFFVTDIEYTHYYGRTFEEHQANIQLALAVNKTYGKDTL